MWWAFLIGAGAFALIAYLQLRGGLSLDTLSRRGKGRGLRPWAAKGAAAISLLGALLAAVASVYLLIRFGW
jgi:hypothetical protein